MKVNVNPSTSNKQKCDLSRQPGPSRQLIDTSHSETDGSSDDEITDDEKCCVCHLFQPRELQECVSIVFTKWAQCDYPSCGSVPSEIST